MYRDFSNRNENFLLRLIQEIDDEQIHEITDFLGDVFLTYDSWFGQLKIKNYLNNVQNYHKKVLDKNNTTKKEIKNIFTQVRSIDVKTARIFSVYSDFLNKSISYIGTLSSIVTPANGIFTAEDVETRLAEQAEKFDAIVQALTIYALQNSPDLRAYDNTKRFIDSRDSDKDAKLYGLSRNWFDTFKGVLKGGLGFDNSTDEAYKNTIATLVDSYVKKNVDFTVSKQIMSCISKYLPGSKDIYDDLVKILENEGYDWAEFSALLGEECEVFLDIIKYSPEIMENFEIILNDYTHTIAVLHEMKEGLRVVNGNERTIEYIDSLIDDYNYKFKTVLKNAAACVVDEVFERAIEYLAGVATGGLLTLAIDAQGLIFYATGATSKGDKLADIYISNQYSDDLISVYEYYLEKIKSGDYTQDDVDKCKQFFEIAKQAKIQEYRNIIEFSDKDSKEILEEEIDRLEDLSWGFCI